MEKVTWWVEGKMKGELSRASVRVGGQDKQHNEGERQNTRDESHCYS